MGGQRAGGPSGLVGEASSPSLKNGQPRRSLPKISSSGRVNYLETAVRERLEIAKVTSTKKVESQAMEKQVSEYLDKIKTRKQEEDFARKERERRRRKVLLEQSLAEAELEQQDQEKILLEKLARHSKQERRIAAQLMQYRHEKDVIKQNRQYRDAQYAARRQKDFEEALAREREFCLRSRAEYEHQTRVQFEQHQEILRRRQEEKSRKHREICRDVVWQIVDLTLKVCEYRNLTENLIPAKLMNEWKTLFLAGNPLTLNYEFPLRRDAVLSAEEIENPSDPTGISLRYPRSALGIDFPNAEADSVLHGVHLLDEEELKDYLKGGGDWAFPTEVEELASTNLTLGRVVDTLLEITTQPEREKNQPRLPDHPVRLALIGKRFSGKTSVAQALAQRYGLAIISTEALLREALAANENKATLVGDSQSTFTQPSNDEVATATPTRGGPLQGSVPGSVAASQTVGSAGAHHLPVEAASVIISDPVVEEAMATLIAGKDLDENAMIALFADAARKYDAMALKGKIGGWVLDGFPRTRSQAQLLERALSGYEDPKPIRPGNMKRGSRVGGPSFIPGSGLNVPSASRKKSLIAPQMKEDEQEEILRAESGIDTVILLETVNIRAISRAAGRRLDPLTGRVYHLEFQPPPLDEVGLHERLIPVDDESADSVQLQHQLAVFEEQDVSLRDWYSRFQNLKSIDANGDLQITLDNVDKIIVDIVDKKKRETDGRISSAYSVQLPAAIPEDKRAEMAGTNGLDGMPSSQQISAVAGSAHSRDPKLKPNSVELTNVVTENVESPPPQIEQVLEKKEEKIRIKHISKDLAELLSDEWKTIEGTYTDIMQFTFRALRREQENIVRFFHDTRAIFSKFLRRPDDRQHYVEIFQANYNEMEDDLRSDPEAKAELHQRAEDLREKLWEISDLNKQEAEKERHTIIEDRWIEDHFGILTNFYITILQCEVDRCLSTKQVVADYFKEAEGKLLEASVVNPVRIPMIELPVGEVLAITDSDEASSSARLRRDYSATISTRRLSLLPLVNGSANQSPATANTTNAAAAAAAANKKVGTFIVRRPAKKEFHLLNSTESDDLFADIHEACASALAAIVPEEEESKEKQKAKDQQVSVRKKGAADQNADGSQDPSLISEFQIEMMKTVKCEDEILKKRVERIRQHAISTLSSLRVKGLELYAQLDEWIGKRYQGEINAVKQMLDVIKEAIENEIRLPNELVLDGENFMVDPLILTLEPEPEPRPESPIEKPLPEQFTVLQLVNLCQQFKECAPKGVISIKEFTENLQRLAFLSSGQEQLPEFMANWDASHFQQMLINFDPFETGFVDWRRFLMVHAKVLPVSKDRIALLKQEYSALDPEKKGLISRTDFLKIPLWFEQNMAASEDFSFSIAPVPPETSNVHPASGVGSAGPAGKFNRPWKLKLAMFEFYSPLDTSDDKNIDDKTKDHGAKSISALSENPADTENPPSEPIETPAPAGEGEKSAPSEGINVTKVEGVESSREHLVSDSTLAVQVNKASDESSIEGQDVQENKSEVKTNQQIDYIAFLQSACMDEDTRAALQKAFIVLSDNGDGCINIEQLYKVFHFGMLVLEETNRFSGDQNVEDPYSMPVLSRGMEAPLSSANDNGVEIIPSSQSKISFEQFWNICEKRGERNLQACPLYQLDV